VHELALLLLLLLLLNAPNEPLLAKHAVLVKRHPFFNHVLYGAIAVLHECVDDAQAVLWLRMKQVIVQVLVQVHVQVHN
jgi:hypothetical protein